MRGPENTEYYSKLSRQIPDEIKQAKIKIKDGGVLTNILRELEESGFITKTHPFGKKIREGLYRLTDQYTLFYLKFIRNQKSAGKGSWASRIDSPQWRAWSGYAFENISLQHIEPIKKHWGSAGSILKFLPG